MAPRVSTSIIRRVLRDPKAILVTDASTDPAFGRKKSVIQRRIKNVICAPVICMQGLLGILFIHGSRPGGNFRMHDLHFATALAFQAGVAYQSLAFFGDSRKN